VIETTKALRGWSQVPNTRITNPTWRTAAILEKSKNCHISAAVRAISTKFDTMT